MGICRLGMKHRHITPKYSYAAVGGATPPSIGVPVWCGSSCLSIFRQRCRINARVGGQESACHAAVDATPASTDNAFSQGIQGRHASLCFSLRFLAPPFSLNGPRPRKTSGATTWGRREVGPSQSCVTAIRRTRGKSRHAREKNTHLLFLHNPLFPLLFYLSRQRLLPFRQIRHNGQLDRVSTHSRRTIAVVREALGSS